MMSRTQTLFIFGVAIGFVLLLIFACTRFYAIASFWSFQGDTSQEIGSGVKISMRIDTKTKAGTVGLLAKSTVPYDLDVGFYTDNPDVTLKAVLLEKLTIQYQDGGKVDLLGAKDERISPFVLRKSSNWEGNRIVHHESVATSEMFTNCINKNVPFTVECKGKLIKKTGEEIPITARWNFQPKKHRGVIPTCYLDSEVTGSQFPKP